MEQEGLVLDRNPEWQWSKVDWTVAVNGEACLLSGPVGLWGLLSRLCDAGQRTWVEWILVDEGDWIVEEQQEH